MPLPCQRLQLQQFSGQKSGAWNAKGANCQGEGGQPLGAPESAPSSKAVELSLCSSEFRSCVEVEVAVLGFPSLINLTVSVDVKQH